MNTDPESVTSGGAMLGHDAGATVTDKPPPSVVFVLLSSVNVSLLKTYGP